MSTPRGDSDPPMAEPGRRTTGGDVGGMRSSGESGVADALQRSTERGEDSPIGRASTGDAGGGAADPRVDMGGKDAPGSADTPSAHRDRPRSDDEATPATRPAGASERPRTQGSANDDDDGDTWRHEPVAPVDEPNPLKSLGRAVADTATGGGEDASAKPTR